MRPLIIGLNSASEEFVPPELVARALNGESSGFDSFWLSDHFHPWFHTGGHSSFAWEVLSAIAVQTRKLIVGTSVTSPIFRYNPAIIAQAFSTLSWLAPGRVFLGSGTGEGLNEVPCGFEWPASYSERIGSLREGLAIIRLLWSKRFVTLDGEYHKIKKANLYDKPPQPPPIHVSGLGPRAAELAGEIGDTFMTLAPPDTSKLTETLFPALEKGASRSGRKLNEVEKSILLAIGYDRQDREKAIDSLLKWRGSLLPVFYDYGDSDPRYIEGHGNLVSREAVAKAMIVATSEEEITREIEKYIGLGFDHIALAPSGDFQGFLELAQRKILPYIHDGHRDRKLESGYSGSFNDANLEHFLVSRELKTRVKIE
jgi:coenzyme F420-dependent glucose-6-phosphate dehydrogenase